MSRQTGKCKWFDRKKGYGFIECPGQPDDVFVHQTEIKLDGFRALYPDQEVEFVIQQSGPNGRPCATNITGPSGDKLQPRAPKRQFAAGSDAAEAGARGGSRRGRGEGGRGARKPRTRRSRQLMNQAFVFIKPHAVNDKVRDLVRTTLEGKGLRVLKEGKLTAEEIDSKKLIDQHYYAIASKATILKPASLVVPNDKFQETFGKSWKQVLDEGNALNAMDACKELGIDADQLDALWAKCKKEKKLVKLGGGFYCGLVEVKGKTPKYVFNGFFMSMRSKFTKPGTSIHYYVVSWPASTMPWADFRGKLLGPTDPADAPAESLRGMLFSQWKELGLSDKPNVGDNGVHASASPFEGLAERTNWLAVDLDKDPFGKAVLAAGLNEDLVREWSLDPQVKGKSVFDTVEDMDAVECLEKLKELADIKA